MSLYDRFVALPRPGEELGFCVEKTDAPWRVGKSFLGHPALLFAFETNEPLSPPRRLTNICYRPPAVVEILGGDGTTREARVAVLECLSLDRDLCSYFFRIVSTILLEGATSGQNAFERSLDALIALFRKLERPSTSSVQGLWAELALILWSAEPVTAVSSWHSDPRQLHDFSAGSFRVEVKGTTKDLREHSFSLDQIAVLTPGCTLIVSVMLQEQGNGQTIFELLEAIKSRLPHHDQTRRLETIVVETLGASWRDAAALRFGVGNARQSLRIFRADAIPTVPQPLPAEVKNVRFDVDLSGLTHLALNDARALGPLFSSILPI